MVSALDIDANRSSSRPRTKTKLEPRFQRKISKKYYESNILKAKAQIEPPLNILSENIVDNTIKTKNKGKVKSIPQKQKNTNKKHSNISGKRKDLEHVQNGLPKKK